MSDSHHTVTVYSDYVCPFCYLGKASLEEYRAESSDPPDVQWQSYDLRGYKRQADGTIDHDVEDGKDESYFEQAAENVRKLREKYDVEMIDIDDVPEGVDSWDAQVLAFAVRGEHGPGVFRRLHDALFEALWRDGRDIGDRTVLRDVAASADIDPGYVDEVLEDDTIEADLEAAFEAAQESGVSAVPTFVYDEYAARGAVPPEHLERLVEGT
jgi:predicted DsbA family dithiol-disulfide isomerase